MFAGLSSWLISPMLLGLGLAAISVPIIIHLLNRRRFKIVDWAAMAFLLDADKKNRRRVRLENLILLLLRCLAMILIGLVLARPFLDPQMLQGMLVNPKYERIVLLDDSLSMQLQTGNQTAMENAVGQVEQLLQRFVNSRSDDSLTLFVSSRPSEPLMTNEPITAESLNDLVSRLKELEPSDQVAEFDIVLQTVDRYVRTEKQNVNHAVYVFSDFRQHDWRVEGEEENPNAPNKLIESISEVTSDCMLIDVGSDTEANITISSIRPRETLIEGVANQFDVVVTNRGDNELRNLTLRLTVGDALPLEREIDRVGAGQNATVTFDYVFAREDRVGAESNPFEDILTNMSSVKVQAEVISTDVSEDTLLADSVGFYAARLIRGVPVMVVDGNAFSLDDESAESIYLARALAPPGETATGVLVDRRRDTEFDSLPLEDYRVIVLCNVRILSEQRIKRLKRWVKDGGGLIILPGDQVIADQFNEQFYENGHGLSPLKLLRIQGDIDEQRWSNFVVDEAPHPVFSIFEGAENPFLNSVKIFSWWGVELQPTEDELREQFKGQIADSNNGESADDASEENSDSSTDEDAADDQVAATMIDPEFIKTPNVMLRLSDVAQTPAVVEKRIGAGRVVMFSIPADRQWTDWPDNPSYVIAMQELITYVSGNLVEDSSLTVGEGIAFPLDLGLFDRRLTIVDPSEDKLNVEAVPEGADAESSDTDDSGESVQADDPSSNVFWNVKFDGVGRRGFYQVNLTRTQGPEMERLYAANVDPREGNLKRFRLASSELNFFGDKAQFIQSGDVASSLKEGNQSEIWFVLLFVLGGVLFLEQGLAWFFGSRR